MGFREQSKRHSIETGTRQERLAPISSDLTVERETVKRLERVVQVLTLELDQARGSTQEGPTSGP